MKVKCPRCGYEWETKTNMVLATCPSCAKRFKRIEHEVKG